MEFRANYVSLDAASLTPAAWESDGPVYIFNPALAHDDQGAMLFYRVVRPGIGRDIGACRLDSNLTPIASSVTAFSDEIDSSDTWFADPRVYVLGGRHYVYWNTGYAEMGENRQYLVEVDVQSLRPVGVPFEITIKGYRNKIEKKKLDFL